MSVPDYLLIGAVVWVVLAAVGRFVVVPRLARGPGGDPFLGFLWFLIKTYCRVWHRVRFEGDELVTGENADPDGLIIVANHTGAVDPLAVQTRCRFLIRWMMAADMMGSQLGWLWHAYPAIPVTRDRKDTRSLREAIRYVRGGGVVGIFPEGRITFPPREIRPFLPGVGLIVSRTRAPVLLAWISGTPDSNKMGEALGTRSHTRVVFLDRIEYDEAMSAEEITEDLRARIHAASGWPFNDEVLPPGGPGDDA
jgi:1-acyl-sn-glycerol-3-phosphate acyltransferase